VAYRFKLCLTPISFCHPEVYEVDFLDGLKAQLKHCDQLYPAYKESALDLISKAAGLIESRESPLLEFLINSEIAIGNKSAILLYRSSMVKATISEFYEYKAEIILKKPSLLRADMVIASHLRSTDCYNKIIVIGPSFLFPDYVFSASRANEIHVIHYNWGGREWKQKTEFIRSYVANHDSDEPRKPLLFNKVIVEQEEDSEGDIGYEELLPTLDWSDISSRYTHESHLSNEQEYVDARLFLLEGDKAVFAEALEGSKILAIDLGDGMDSFQNQAIQAKRILKKIAVTDVEPGLFILLRTSGGGDYIEPLADKILGGRAVLARETQQSWKTLLRKTVGKIGLFETSVNLLYLGSVRANEANVRNWMSGKNIRPQDYKDFAAIMKLIGLEDKTGEYWSVAELIDRAHRKAGHHIRNLLLKQVMQADLRKLERLGEMVFELPEADGGSLTALRITDVSPDTLSVPIFRLGHLFVRDD
jgi:hypothetical protein